MVSYVLPGCHFKEKRRALLFGSQIPRGDVAQWYRTSLACMKSIPSTFKNKTIKSQYCQAEVSSQLPVGRASLLPIWLTDF